MLSISIVKADCVENFTPYQLVLGTLTVVYALRHVGDIFGLGSKLVIPLREPGLMQSSGTISCSCTSAIN